MYSLEGDTHTSLTSNRVSTFQHRIQQIPCLNRILQSVLYDLFATHRQLPIRPQTQILDIDLLRNFMLESYIVLHFLVSCCIQQLLSNRS
jgi:hypothetical protein